MSFLYMLLIGVLIRIAAADKDFIAKLTNAKAVIQESLNEISLEWNVSLYPNFLKSASTSRHSFDYMKHKYMDRIMSSAKKRGVWIASFTGSSVTAGHDSMFAASTSEQVGLLMKKAFAALNIDFISRNGALGNNPCVPYDLCPGKFAGRDADMVGWEQSYFCFGGAIIEQFIRQSVMMPSHPIVFFSESSTGHWDKNKCKTFPHKITSAEQALLSASPEKVMTDMNRDEAGRAFGYLSQYEQNYPAAGIQKFTHEKHTDYACLGPYINDWMLGAASWHPSVIAHRLRASHHAYFWLVGLRGAVTELLMHLDKEPHRSVDALARHTSEKMVEYNQKHNKLPPAHHATPFADGMQCLTDYQPSFDPDTSLRGAVLSGLDTASPSASDGPLTGPNLNTQWKAIIYENLVDRKLVENSLQRGYKDFKHLLYGNKHAGPIVFKLSIKAKGPIFMCQTPGIWGKLPTNFVDLWTAQPTLELTPVGSSSGGSISLGLSHTKDLDICVQLHSLSGHNAKDVQSTSFERGEYNLKVLTNSTSNIIIAWILTT